MFKKIFNLYKEYRKKKLKESDTALNEKNQNHLLPYNNPSFNIPKNYTLILERFSPGIWKDSEMSLSLYNGSEKADALIGFQVVKDSLIVEQIQARKGVKKLPSKWERILLESAINYAIEQGCSQIHVIKAENNEWYQYPSRISSISDYKKHKLRMKIRYDVTSKRRGFVLDEKLNEWVLNLESIVDSTPPLPKSL